MYGKLFQQMYEGTLATRGPWQALVTFQQMIVLCDKNGVIDMTADAISRRTTIPIDIIEAGIKHLEMPDKGSRTPDEEGRRIVRLREHTEWGWRIVNYLKYRELQREEGRTAYHRQYWHTRKGKKGVDSTALNTTQPTQPSQPMQRQRQEADAEEELLHTTTQDLDQPAAVEKPPTDAQTVFAHWQSVHGHPKSVLSKDRRSKILARLKDYDVATLCQSISGYLNSPHNMGQNERGEKFDDIALMLRDSAHVEKGLRCYENPPRSPGFTPAQQQMLDSLAQHQPPEIRNAKK